MIVNQFQLEELLKNQPRLVLSLEMTREDSFKAFLESLRPKPEDVPMSFRAKEDRGNSARTENPRERSLDYTFKQGKHEGSTVRQVIDRDLAFITYIMDNYDFVLDNEAFLYYESRVHSEDTPLYYTGEEE